MLADTEDERRFCFVQSAQEALDAIRSEVFDVIMTRHDERQAPRSELRLEAFRGEPLFDHWRHVAGDLCGHDPEECL